MSKRYREYGLALLLSAVAGLLALVLLGQWVHYRSVRSDLVRRLSEIIEVRLNQ